ncbi:hypothetical protein MCEMSE15_01397 [Fimbriimonadaceae bacterium]
MQLGQRQSVQAQIAFWVIAYLGYAWWKASQIESSHAPYLAGIALCFVLCAFLAWVHGAKSRRYPTYTELLVILAGIGSIASPKGVFSALSGLGLFGLLLTFTAYCLSTQTESTALPFPRSFIANDAELSVIADCRRLEKCVFEISEEVSRLLKESARPELLIELSRRATFSGISLFNGFVLVGKVVLKRSKPYWMSGPLFTHEQVAELKMNESQSLGGLLDSVLTIEKRLAMVLGAPCGQ